MMPLLMSIPRYLSPGAELRRTTESQRPLELPQESLGVGRSSKQLLFTWIDTDLLCKFSFGSMI